MVVGRIWFWMASQQEQDKCIEINFFSVTQFLVFVSSVWSADHIPALSLPVFSSHSSFALL